MVIRDNAAISGNRGVDNAFLQGENMRVDVEEYQQASYIVCFENQHYC